MLVAGQSGCDLPAVPARKLHLRHTGASGDWLTVLRVFGHGLCAWRYSNAGSESLVCTLDAPDRRSPAFYPFKSQSPNGNALKWPKNSFRGSQHKRFSRNGADRSRGSVGECRNSQPNGLPHSWMMLRPPRSSSAPGTPLRNQFVAARWGAAGFRSRGVRLALQHSLGCGRCCLHLGRWAESGRSFLLSRGGPVSHWGSCPGACCVRRVAAQPYGGWLARGETRQRAKNGSHAACAYRSNAHA